MANSKSKSSKKKVVVDYGAKRERKIKEFLLFDTSLYVPDLDDTINGQKIVGLVNKFGKSYFKVQNIVTSL